MSNTIQELENEQLKNDVPDFKAGDTVTVQVRVREGETGPNRCCIRNV